jgi:hypothetical protein
MRVPIESAHTCPDRSTSSAELMATTSRSCGYGRCRSCDRRDGTRRTGCRARSRTRAVVPITKLVMMRPGCSFFSRLVMAPASARSTTPSENISVWTPRSCLFISRRSTASGMAPMPICSVAPSLNERGHVLADGILDGDGVSCADGRMERPVRVDPGVDAAEGTSVLPRVRGICSLISATMYRADWNGGHAPCRPTCRACSSRVDPAARAAGARRRAGYGRR